MDTTTENKQASADLLPKELSELEKIQAMMKQATPEYDPANYPSVYYPKIRTTSWPLIHKRGPYPNLTWRNPNAAVPSKSSPVVRVTQQNSTRKSTLKRQPKVLDVSRGAVLKPKGQPAVPIINLATARMEANKVHRIVQQPNNSNIIPDDNKKNLSKLKLIPVKPLRQRADNIRSNLENSKPEKVAEGTQKSPVKINQPKVKKSEKLSLDLENQRSPAATQTFQQQQAQHMTFSNNHHPSSWGQMQSTSPSLQRHPLHGLNGSPEDLGLPCSKQQRQWGQTPRMRMPPNVPPSFRPIQSPPVIPVAPPPAQRFHGSPPSGHMPNSSWPPHSRKRHGPPMEYYESPSPPMNHNDYTLGRLTTNAHGSPPQRMDEPFRDIKAKSRLCLIDDPEAEFKRFIADMDFRKMLARQIPGARKRPRSRSNSPVDKKRIRYSPKRRHSRRSSSRSPIRSRTEKRISAAPTRTTRSSKSWQRRDDRSRSRSPLRITSPPPRLDSRSSFIDLPGEGSKWKEKRMYSPTSSRSSSSADSHCSRKERKDKNINTMKRKSKD